MKTWHEARTACRRLGADLVSVMSITEQSWLESYLYMGTLYMCVCVCECVCTCLFSFNHFLSNSHK